MSRHLLLCAILILGSFLSGLFGCLFAAMGVAHFGEKVEQVQAIYRCDPWMSSAPPSALEEARKIFAARLKELDASRIRVSTVGQDHVSLNFELPIAANRDAGVEVASRNDLDPGVREFLEQHGNLHFLQVARAVDLARLGSDFDRERQLVDGWRGEHPGIGIESFNALPREQGGPVRGLCWVPKRAEGAEAQATSELMALLTPDPEWVFTAADIASASRTNDSHGRRAVHFEMKEARKDAFGHFTESLDDSQLAIVVSGRILSAPVVHGRLPGSGLIEGGAKGFTRAETQQMVRVLNSGELPLRPTLVSASRSLHRSYAAGAGFIAFTAFAFLVCIGLIVLLVMSLRTRAPRPAEDWSDRAQTKAR